MINTVIWKKIHNYIGLTSSIFLVVLLFTGVLLNHPDWISKNETLIVVQDPFEAGKLFMGKKDGLFFSVDQGKSWNEVDMLFPPRDVADIAFATNARGGIYVLEKWGKILWTKDGKVWDDTALPFDPQETGVDLKKISVGTQGEICVFTSGGWLLSRNEGKDWNTDSFDPHSKPLMRTILMLHNGYFFGPRFVWIYDFAAGGLLILIVTGFILWKIGKKIG